MSTDPDAFERSRAAVAVSCLKWLQCTGPAPSAGPARDPVPARSWDEPLVRLIPVSESPAPPRHPLWDRWIDG